jgi:hypothetical protein
MVFYTGILEHNAEETSVEHQTENELDKMIYEGS